MMMRHSDDDDDDEYEYKYFYDKEDEMEEDITSDDYHDEICRLRISGL